MAAGWKAQTNPLRSYGGTPRRVLSVTRRKDRNTEKDTRNGPFKKPC